MPASQLYERDFYAWANEQAALLRGGKLAQADVEHIAEELESMGRTEKRELISRLTILMLHLLKWQYQPALRSQSWRATIRLQRRDLTSHLGDNPSLQAILSEAIERAYGNAIIEAEAETGLPEPVVFRRDDRRQLLAGRQAVRRTVCRCGSLALLAP